VQDKQMWKTKFGCDFAIS